MKSVLDKEVILHWHCVMSVKGSVKWKREMGHKALSLLARLVSTNDVTNTILHTVLTGHALPWTVYNDEAAI